jgi:hypothetical protein
MERPFARVVAARFDVVADAYAACRSAHLARETHASIELDELSARVARLERLVELALSGRKKIGDA